MKLRGGFDDDVDWRAVARLILSGLIFSVVYFICALLSTNIFWLPSGLHIAVLLLTPIQAWPLYITAAIPAQVAADFFQDMGFKSSFFGGLGNHMEAVIGALILRRMFGPAMALRNLKEVLGFTVFGALLSSTISASIGALIVGAPGKPPGWAAWQQWWFSEALGILVIAPPILTWSATEVRDLRLRITWPMAEAIVLFAGLCGVVYLVFSQNQPFDVSLLYLAFPFLIWAAVRFGVRGAATASFLLFSVAGWLTSWGLGPFAAAGRSIHDSSVSLQAYLAVSVLSSLTLAVVLKERERADERLRESEKKSRQSFDELEQIYRSAPAGLCFMDPQLRFVRINERLAAVNGKPVSEHIGRTLAEVIPEISAKVEPVYREVIRTGQPILDYELEAPAPTAPDVMRVWLMNYHPVVGEDRKVWGINVVLQDITERKRGEVALQRSNELTQRIVETMPGGVLQVDREGLIVRANAAAQQFLAYAADQLCTMNVQDWEGKTFLEDGSPCPSEEFPVNRCLATGQPQPPTTLGFRRPDGLIGWGVLSASPLVEPKTQMVDGAVLTMVDITTRKVDEEQRKRLQTHLQHIQKLESLGILAGGIAHDFNNLLVGVLGYAGLLLEDLPQGSPLHYKVEQIITGATRAAELTNQMLAYSGKGKFIVQPTDLSQVASEMGRLLGTAVSPNATLRFDLTEGLPKVEADATQVRQVLMNLIMNASDALGDKPGTITLRTGTVYADRRYFDNTYLQEELTEGFYVFLDVSDTGAGMDPQTQTKIFDPFYTTKSPGRGLGLAAVLGIVRGHRGAIRVSSRKGHGTSFRVLFPIAQDQREEPAEGTPNALEWRGPGKILVVDDEEAVRSIVKVMLEKVEFSVIGASDGAEALDLVRKFGAEISLMILDLTMPGMSAEEVMTAVREIRPDMKVILSSGYSEQEVVAHIRDHSGTGFLQKPYNAKQLIGTVRAALNSTPVTTPAAS